MYDTPMTMEQWNQYLVDWGKRAPLEEEDYDLRGAYLNGFKPGSGHGTDQFKKPNHPTFSEESQYSNLLHRGGRWTDNTFVPSPQMYGDKARMEELVRYLRGPAEQGKIYMVPPYIASPGE